MNQEELLKQALLQRGHRITKFGSYKDIYVPQDSNPQILSAFEDMLYDLMTQPSFRSALRNWSFNSTIQSQPAKRQIEDYMKKCAGFDCPRKSQGRYSNTFEWFISEVIKREFGAKTSGFGIRLKDASPDDEFDCLAILDNGLLYTECKTGRTEIKTEIKKFAQRDAEVCANYSMLILDRDYVFKNDEEDAPMLTNQDAAALGIHNIANVKYKKTNLIRIDAVGNRYFFVFGGMKKLNDKIRYTIKYINSFNDGQANPAGFEVKKIPWTQKT